MKSLFKLIALFFFLNAFTCAAPQNATAQVSVDFKIFYDELSPYGSWVNTTEYGYAWIPDVADDFEPYNTNGYWIFTDDGWTWVSDYSWGWAPFHYGRWYEDPYYGPMWIPGNEWGPGWVTWRQSEGYYGWAPIGPGISIDIAYGNSYNLPYNQWTFVRDRDFGRNNINKYYVDRSVNITIINNSTVINNVRNDGRDHVRYNGGPDRNDVQKRSGNNVTPIIIRESNKPGQHLNKSDMEVYRPRIEQNNNAGQRPVPTKVKELKDVRQGKNRNAANDGQQQNKPVQQQTTAPQRQQPQQPERQQPQQPQRQQPQQPERQQPQKQQPQQPERQQPQQPQKQQPQKQQPQQPERQQPQRQQPQQPQRQQPQQPQRQPQPKQPERQQPQRQQPQRQQPQQPQQPQKQPQPKQPERQQPQRQQQPKQPERQQPKDKHDNNPKKELAIVMITTDSSIA